MLTSFSTCAYDVVVVETTLQQPSDLWIGQALNSIDTLYFSPNLPFTAIY